MTESTRRLSAAGEEARATLERSRSEIRRIRATAESQARRLVSQTDAEADRHLQRHMDRLTASRADLRESAARSEHMLRAMAETLSRAAEDLLHEAASGHVSWQSDDQAATIGVHELEAKESNDDQ